LLASLTVPWPVSVVSRKLLFAIAIFLLYPGSMPRNVATPSVLQCSFWFFSWFADMLLQFVALVPLNHGVGDVACLDTLESLSPCFYTR
jgi:hypothetical protein